MVIRFRATDLQEVKDCALGLDVELKVFNHSNSPNGAILNVDAEVSGSINSVALLFYRFGKDPKITGYVNIIS